MYYTSTILNGDWFTVFFCLDKNTQIVYNQLRVLSSMDRMPCFELGDVGSIPAGPAKIFRIDKTHYKYFCNAGAPTSDIN